MNQSPAAPGQFSAPAWQQQDAAGALQRAQAQREQAAASIWRAPTKEPAPGSLGGRRPPPEIAHPDTGGYQPTAADKAMVGPGEAVRDITPNYRNQTQQSIFQGEGANGEITYSDNYQGATQRGLDRDIQRDGLQVGDFKMKGGRDFAANSQNLANFAESQYGRTPEGQAARAWEGYKRQAASGSNEGLPPISEAYRVLWDRKNPNSVVSIGEQSRQREAEIRAAYVQRFGAKKPAEAAPAPARPGEDPLGIRTLMPGPTRDVWQLMNPTPDWLPKDKWPTAGAPAGADPLATRTLVPGARNDVLQYMQLPDWLPKDKWPAAGVPAGVTSDVSYSMPNDQIQALWSAVQREPTAEQQRLAAYKQGNNPTNTRISWPETMPAEQVGSPLGLGAQRTSGQMSPRQVGDGRRPSPERQVPEHLRLKYNPSMLQAAQASRMPSYIPSGEISPYVGTVTPYQVPEQARPSPQATVDPSAVTGYIPSPYASSWSKVAQGAERARQEAANKQRLMGSIRPPVSLEEILREKSRL